MTWGKKNSCACLLERGAWEAHRTTSRTSKKTRQRRNSRVFTFCLLNPGSSQILFLQEQESVVKSEMRLTWKNVSPVRQRVWRSWNKRPPFFRGTRTSSPSSTLFPSRSHDVDDVEVLGEETSSSLVHIDVGDKLRFHKNAMTCFPLKMLEK